MASRMPRSLRAIARARSVGAFTQNGGGPAELCRAFPGVWSGVIAGRGRARLVRSRDCQRLNVRLRRRGPDDQWRMGIEQMRVRAGRLMRIQRPQPQRRCRARRGDGSRRHHQRMPAVLADAVLAREVVVHVDRVPTLIAGELDRHGDGP